MFYKVRGDNNFRLVMQQWQPDALMKPKILLGTYGSDALARPAIQFAKENDATLVVCFIRQVNVSYKYESESKLTIETDLMALKAFSRFLDIGREMGVRVLPIYDSGPDAAELARAGHHTRY